MSTKTEKGSAALIGQEGTVRSISMTHSPPGSRLMNGADTSAPQLPIPSIFALTTSFHCAASVDNVNSASIWASAARAVNRPSSAMQTNVRYLDISILQ